MAAAVVGAATKPHALLLHSHLTHGMDRKTHMWQTLANLLGASAINASTQIMAATALFGRAVDLEEVPAVLESLFGGLAAVLFSVALFAASLSASAVSVETGVLMFRYTTGRRFSAAEARLTARLVSIAPALAALHLGANPWCYTQYVLSLVLPVVMTATVRWSWHMVGTAGRAAALAGTVFVTADYTPLLPARTPRIFLSASLSLAMRCTTSGLTTCSSFSVSRNVSSGVRPISRKNSSRVLCIWLSSSTRLQPASVRLRLFLPLYVTSPSASSSLTIFKALLGYTPRDRASFEGVTPSPKGCVASR
jgi:hypothetical protein